MPSCIQQLELEASGKWLLALQPACSLSLHAVTTQNTPSPSNRYLAITTSYITRAGYISSASNGYLAITTSYITHAISAGELS